MAYARAATMIATPIGPIRIEAQGDVLTGIWIDDGRGPESSDHPLLRRAAGQLDAYFAGDRILFDLPLAMPATPRGAALRDAIISIGYGDTRTYGELAAQAGSSARAIGQACARNPFPIIVPCHRVLGAGDALGPYSAGHGSSTKAWLLRHEGAKGLLL